MGTAAVKPLGRQVPGKGMTRNVKETFFIYYSINKCLGAKLNSQPGHLVTIASHDVPAALQVDETGSHQG